MEMLNRAIEDAADYRGMMEKIMDKRDVELMKAAQPVSREVAEWNAEVERKRAEKKARKAQHVKALDGLR